MNRGLSRPDVLWYLTIHHVETDGVPVLLLSGRLSSSVVQELGQAIAAASSGGAHGVAVDLTHVDYISSAALHALEAAASRLHAHGHELVLCGIQQAVGQTLALTGPPRHVAVEESRELAAARLASRAK